MAFEYIFMRLARRNLPKSIIHFLLRRNWIIRAGRETNNPKSAVECYKRELDLWSKNITDCVVLDFGYGGFFGTAIELLQQGAKHIYLYDKYATPDNKKNAKLLEKHGEYLYAVRENILPNPDFITLINEDIYSYVQHIKDLEVDLVLSSSVFEHLDDVDNATHALMKMTALNGIHIHFIDLRDHYFKYPFQMLCYSERTWKRFLNAENNLNRLRVRDYEKLFRKYFMDIQYKIIESDIDLYKKVKDKVMSEFITGDDKIDSATKIVIIASRPLRIDRRCSK
jgi:hypothetical protein